MDWNKVTRLPKILENAMFPTLRGPPSQFVFEASLWYSVSVCAYLLSLSATFLCVLTPVEQHTPDIFPVIQLHDLCLLKLGLQATHGVELKHVSASAHTSTPSETRRTVLSRIVGTGMAVAASVVLPSPAVAATAIADATPLIAPPSPMSDRYASVSICMHRRSKKAWRRTASRHCSTPQLKDERFDSKLASFTRAVRSCQRCSDTSLVVITTQWLRQKKFQSTTAQASAL